MSRRGRTPSIGSPSSKVVRERRKHIQDLQRYLCEQVPEEDHIEHRLRHHFATGVYGREIILEKGSLTVGKIHRHDHLNIISYGKVVVATDQGVETLQGPTTFTSPRGCKRVVYALEETMWTTIHVTDKTDLGEIEEEVIAKSYDELPKLEGGKE